MESAGGSGGGGGGDGACSGGHLCHVCGYKYPSAHPSAKQRRAHRKNCGGGKPPSASAAAAEEEGDGKKLLLGEDEGEAGGGAGASDCGGGFPGSAQDEGNAENSSPNGAGVEVIVNRSTEDCLITCDNIPSEVASKANGTDNDEILSEVATQLPESAQQLEYWHPSQPGVSCDQCQDASASHCPSEDGAIFSSEFSADEISKSSVVSLSSNAASGEISAQTNAIVGCPDVTAVTEEDCMSNSIGKDKTTEDVLAKGSEIDSSYEEKLHTEIVEGHSATTVEVDPSGNNFTAVSKEEITGEETESKEQSGVVLTSSIEQVSTTKEPANLLGNESWTEKHVCTDDTSGGDLFEFASGGCHLEAADAVKPQQQTESIPVAADQLTISKQTDNEEGQHCPDADGIIQDVSSATGHAVGAEVISAGSAASLTKKDCTSEVTMGDGVHDNVSHTSGITFMPSQVDLAELSSYPTSHDINTVRSIDGVEENRQNEDISADLTSHEINEMGSIDVEEKQQNEEITAYATSHDINAVCSTGNFGENKQNEDIIAEASSEKISVARGTDSVEEKEHIEEVIANPDSDKINVISRRDNDEEKQQSQVYVETTHEINVTCSIENVEGKKQDEEITANAVCEISAVNIPSNDELTKHSEEPTAAEINMVNVTDNVEEKKQNEEITTDPMHDAIDLICSPDNEDKKQNDDMTAPSPHEIIAVHGRDNAKEKIEEIMPDPTSHKIDAVNTTEDVEEKNQNGATVDPTSCGINAVHTVDNVEEKKSVEPASDPTSYKISAESNTNDVEEKMRNEETAVVPSSHENNVPQGTDNAEEKKQNEEVAADPATDKITDAQGTDDVEEKKQEEEAATSDINTTQTANDDQNEEITDKEMTINSDKSHVSLKALLSEKGAETKEKKASTKDRVLSFRRRSSKDNESPAKPGSGQQDWNSPARLPVEKAPKGKKQQWMPFICCPSIN